MTEHSPTYYMVEYLYEEINQPLAKQRYTDWEIKFITYIAVQFTNDPEYELTENQYKSLMRIWEKP